MTYYKHFGKHKTLELQLKLKKKFNYLYYFSSSFSIKGDHPGFYLFFSVLGFFFDFNFYDNRHEEDYETL